jgi:hypothetical protein
MDFMRNWIYVCLVAIVGVVVPRSAFAQIMPALNLSATSIFGTGNVTVTSAPPQGQAVVQPSDFVYQTYYDVYTDGMDTTYMAYLAGRYVNGQLRFLTMTDRGILQEFTLAGLSPHDAVRTTTHQWDLTSVGVVQDFNGIWFNAETNRFWITGTADYTADFAPAHLTTMTLNDDNTIQRRASRDYRQPPRETRVRRMPTNSRLVSRRARR